MSNKRLFLLDAYALIYRAYFAMNNNPRYNSKGLNTSAVLGFANTLLDVLTNEKPTHIAVCFDTGAPTTREIEFTEYKANRDETPEDIRISVPYIIRLIEAFNIPVIGVDGYEADDVIGVLAREAEKKGFETYIMSSDKDLGQLVTEKTFMYKPGKFGQKGEVWGIAEVCNRFGLKRTDQVIDFLGLMGDKVDNIPGIPGVGEKTASKLLQEYDTLENVLANAKNIKGKLGENIQQHAEQAIFSKKLATIIFDIDIEFNEDELIRTEPNKTDMEALLAELEFRTLAKRIFGQSLSVTSTLPVSNPKQQIPDLFSIADENIDNVVALKTIETVPHNYYVIHTAEECLNLIAKIQEKGSFCFDTETTGIDANNCELVGISFSIKPHEAWYMPVSENYQDAAELLSLFKTVFEDENILKIGQNIKFDIGILQWYEIKVKGPIFDTMLAHYLIQPELKHNMDYLAESYLQYKTVPIENLIGKKGKDQKTMREVDQKTISNYAAEDADITLQLKQLFEKELKENELETLFFTVETPLIPVLAAMEAEGINLDITNLKTYSIQLEQEIAQLESEIYKTAGMSFNIASPKQLGEVLFDVLKIDDKARKTKTKQYSTGEDILLKYQAKHPIINLILDFRSLSKLKSTYIDALPLLINPRTHRIHSSFNQTITATGRLSSNNPNLQNIPIRTERGREIRKAFVPRNAQYTILSADYSQIELRVIASLSQEKAMCDDFRSGIDIHTATAAKVYNIHPDEVSKEMRRNAKMVNFGIIYGISAFGLSERLGIPRSEAAFLIEQYFIKYPGIKHYMESQVQFARENGYVETIMKRRRYLRDINSANAVVRNFAERNAVNAPIQGSAADMIKMAMIKIHQEIEKRNLRSRLILQVHDELVFDVYLPELDEMKELVKTLMINALPLDVPIEVEMNHGENWLVAH